MNAWVPCQSGLLLCWHSCLADCADSVNQGIIIRLTTCPMLLFLCFGTEIGNLTGAPEIYRGEKKNTQKRRRRGKKCAVIRDFCCKSRDTTWVWLWQNQTWQCGSRINLQGCEDNISWDMSLNYIKNFYEGCVSIIQILKNVLVQSVYFNTILLSMNNKFLYIYGE